MTTICIATWGLVVTWEHLLALWVSSPLWRDSFTRWHADNTTFRLLLSVKVSKFWLRPTLSILILVISWFSINVSRIWVWWFFTTIIRWFLLAKSILFWIVASIVVEWIVLGSLSVVLRRLLNSTVLHVVTAVVWVIRTRTNWWIVRKRLHWYLSLCGSIS